MDEFKKQGIHFIRADGKNKLLNLIQVAEGFKIPYLVIVDGDGNLTEENKKIIKLCGHPIEYPNLNQAIKKKNMIMWKSNLRSELIEEIGQVQWEEIENAVRNNLQLDASVGQKNWMLIAGIVEEMSFRNLKSQKLEDVIERMVKIH